MSIQVNTGVNAINWEAILSQIGDVEKTVGADGKEALTISMKGADGVTRSATINVPELELPDGVDEVSINTLVDKLAASGLSFTDEQIAQMKDAIKGAYESAAKIVAEPQNFGGKKGILFDLYAIMALMIEVAQTQRDSARDLRTAQNQAIQKAIQDQAEQQRSAAMTGMIVGIVCGVASAAVSAGLMVGQSVTASAQSKILSQSGADSAKMQATMLQNADSPANATAQLQKIEGKVGADVAGRVNDEFNAKLSAGQDGDLKVAFDNANDSVTAAEQNLATKNTELETAQNTLDEKQGTVRQSETALREKQAYIRQQMDSGQPVDEARLAEFDGRIGNIEQKRAELTTAQNDVRIKQGAVENANTELTKAKTAQTQAKENYSKSVQDVAAQYKDKYQDAVDRLANPPPNSNKAELKAAVATAKKEMQMAFAKEASLLAQDGVMTPAEHKDMLSAARMRVDVTSERATQRTDFKAAERRMVALGGINAINQAIGGMLQSMAQNLSTIQQADATKTGAERQKEEEMLDQTKDLFQQEQKIIDQTVQLLQAVIQAETQSMRDAIQA